MSEEKEICRIRMLQTSRGVELRMESAEGTPIASLSMEDALALVGEGKGSPSDTPWQQKTIQSVLSYRNSYIASLYTHSSISEQIYNIINLFDFWSTRARARTHETSSPSTNSGSRAEGEFRSHLQKTQQSSTNLKLRLRKDAGSDIITVDERRVLHLLEFWNESGMRRHKKRLTATYHESIRHLNRLLNGTLFTKAITPEVEPKWFGHKFTEHEFKLAVERVALAACDTEYYPKSKSYLRSLSLIDFFYAARSNFQKSTFLFYLENEPRPMRTFEDPYPEITEAAIKQYFKKVCNGIEREMSVKEREQVAEAVFRLMNVLRVNSEKVDQVKLKQPASVASLLIESAIAGSYGDASKVHPGRLSHDWTFDKVADMMNRLGWFSSSDVLKKRSPIGKVAE